MRLYACTIFASAFLLFLLQPIIAKQILPWFGGSAAVWTTCLVFFQVALLAGYAYSDLTTRKLRPRAQAMLHIALLVASLAVLPIVADGSWKPVGSEDPGTAHPGAAARHHRPALFHAGDHRATRPGVVRAQLSAGHGIPAVRAVEPRLDAGADLLSIRVRNLGHDTDTGVRMVSGLCRLRPAVRRFRPLQPASAMSLSPSLRWLDQRDCACARRLRRLFVARAIRDGLVAAARHHESHHAEIASIPFCGWRR